MRAQLLQWFWGCPCSARSTHPLSAVIGLFVHCYECCWPLLPASAAYCPILESWKILLVESNKFWQVLEIVTFHSWPMQISLSIAHYIECPDATLRNPHLNLMSWSLLSAAIAKSLSNCVVWTTYVFTKAKVRCTGIVASVEPSSGSWLCSMSGNHFMMFTCSIKNKWQGLFASGSFRGRGPAGQLRFSALTAGQSLPKSAGSLWLRNRWYI